jgi:hypothetical protein
MNLSGKRNPLAWADFSSTDTLEQPKITTLSQDAPTSQLGFSSSDAGFAFLHSSGQTKGPKTQAGRNGRPSPRQCDRKSQRTHLK